MSLETVDSTLWTVEEEGEQEEEGAVEVFRREGGSSGAETSPRWGEGDRSGRQGGTAAGERCQTRWDECDDAEPAGRQLGTLRSAAEGIDAANFVSSRRPRDERTLSRQTCWRRIERGGGGGRNGAPGVAEVVKVDCSDELGGFCVRPVACFGSKQSQEARP